MASINVCSFNVNGLRHSKSFIESYLSANPDTILAVQEHWLLPSHKRNCGTNALKNVHPNFDGWGTSAMNESVTNKIRIGRSYGGTGFIFNRKFSLSVKPSLSREI